MGRYQLSRKDTKFNNRYHSDLARKTEAEKIARAKQTKNKKLAKENVQPPTQS